MQTDLADFTLLLQSTFSYWQDFSGVMNDENRSPIFESAKQEAYFQNSWTSNYSTSFLITKNISKQLGINLGLAYALKRKNNYNKILGINYHGLGISTGLTYSLTK